MSNRIAGESAKPSAVDLPPTRRLLRVGVVGTLLTALCCFTPVLVLTLGAVGLSAAVGLLDWVLLPAMAGFVLLTGCALWRRRRARC
jgi:mercuric ion transport protein